MERESALYGTSHSRAFSVRTLWPLWRFLFRPQVSRKPFLKQLGWFLHSGRQLWTLSKTVKLERKGGSEREMRRTGWIWSVMMVGKPTTSGERWAKRRDRISFVENVVLISSHALASHRMFYNKSVLLFRFPRPTPNSQLTRDTTLLLKRAYWMWPS